MSGGQVERRSDRNFRSRTNAARWNDRGATNRWAVMDGRRVNDLEAFAQSQVKRDSGYHEHHHLRERECVAITIIAAVSM